MHSTLVSPERSRQLHFDVDDPPTVTLIVDFPFFITDKFSLFMLSDVFMILLSL
jgi:hypothetical protein